GWCWLLLLRDGHRLVHGRHVLLRPRIRRLGFGRYFFADEGVSMLRAPGTVAKKTGFEVDTSSSYTTVCYAISVELADELLDNSDAVWQLEKSSMELLTQLSMIRRERAFATGFMATSVWNTNGDKAGSTDFTKWSDYGASDPFTDLEDGIAGVGDAVGKDANKLVMGNIVWRRLKHHPDFIDRISGGATSSSPALLTQQLLASFLGLDEIIVAKARYRSSAEGAATLTLAPIVDDDCLLLYAPRTAQLMTPTGGATFIWKTRAAGTAAPQYIRRGVETRAGYVWIEVRQYFDQKVTERNAGWFISDCVD
ncbi:hypothetical protein LCGC14_2129190, partial [marine sediment metagenome]